MEEITKHDMNRVVAEANMIEGLAVKLAFLKQLSEEKMLNCEKFNEEVASSFELKQLKAIKVSLADIYSRLYLKDVKTRMDSVFSEE